MISGECRRYLALFLDWIVPTSLSSLHRSVNKLPKSSISCNTNIFGIDRPLVQVVFAALCLTILLYIAFTVLVQRHGSAADEETKATECVEF